MRELSKLGEKIAARLEAGGYILNRDIGIPHANFGYRAAARHDDTVVLWEAWAWKKSDPVRVASLHVVSYDRMKDCARGLTVSEDDGLLWVYATQDGRKE
jgi:hypothetical protein